MPANLYTSRPATKFLHEIPSSSDLSLLVVLRDALRAGIVAGYEKTYSGRPNEGQ